MLSGAQLAHFLGKSDPKTLPFFRGVYGIDEITNAETNCDFNSSNLFVFNSAAISTPGKHWLGIFIDFDSGCTFIDSLAQTPKHYSSPLADFIFRIHSNTMLLPWAVQQSNTNDCGLYLCLFFHELCLGHSPNLVCNRIFKQKNFHHNSATVRMWYSNTFQNSFKSLFGS